MKKELQERVKKNIQQFDLCALIRLLHSHGKEAYFVSNNSHATACALCHQIIFDEESPRVTIVLNMGLLHYLSLLPSYFQQLMDEEVINADLFLRYMSFFNHHLINSFVIMTMPEMHKAFFLNWQQTQHHYLSLLGLESISTLSFLMKICFPDLVVDVKKNPRVMRVHSSSLVLGKDNLGYSAFLGNRLQETLSSFKIILSTENELTEMGTPWPVEINKRLNEMIYPILKKTDLHLSIVLIIKSKSNYLALGPESFLGYDRIWKSASPFQLPIFYGLVRELKLAKL